MLAQRLNALNAWNNLSQSDDIIKQ